MSWKSLQDQDRIEPHVTTKAELGELRAAIERNLNDAEITQLSNDNRFAIAYQAALLVAKMAIACVGYRVKGQGAHRTTFQAMKLALGTSVNVTADYLDRCRRKRNDLVYDSEGVVSSADAAELLKAAKSLYGNVEAWVAKHYPKLA